jgi:multidrug efflux system outer membrane protein
VRRRGPAAVGLLASLAAAGCLLGPHYERPALEVPPVYREPTAAGATSVERDWWTLFQDPILTALEEQARAANQDLQAAMARVAEARATARIAESDFYPVITLDPSRTNARLSANRPASSSASISGKTTSDTRVPFDLSYEIDLWGRVRRTFESATAAARASADDYGVVALTLAADVAQQYFAVRSLDAQEEILRANIAIFGDQLHLVEVRHRTGLVSELDVAQARTQLSSTIAQEIDVRRQRAESEHALAVLCGQPAPDFSVAVQPPPGLPPEVPSGLPSALLEQRPDIAEAEQHLVAANAEIGVAEALFFPQVRITGAAGFESADFGDLLKWESRIWSIGPSISVPVFEGGRLRANLEGARARYEEAVAAYRGTVLAAFRDVEDALVGVRLRADQNDAQAEAVEAATRAVTIAKSQYDHGITDYLQVIIADRARLDLELSAAQTREAQLDATVLLVKAIGGGWQ